MNILFVDGCVRGEISRTLKLTQTFLDRFCERNTSATVTRLNLGEMNLQYMVGELFERREEMIKSGKLDHEMFDLAKQFASADMIIIAAPFWDLGLPAVVKVFIENVTVLGITFCMGERGMQGLCKARDLVFVTTRGGIYNGNDMDVATHYVKALSKMYGIENLHCLDAEGIDIIPYDEGILNDAHIKAKSLAEHLYRQTT